MDKSDILHWLEKISPIPHHCGSQLFQHGVINPWRVINDHELFMFSGGHARFVVDEQEYPCPNSSFLIIPPGVRHISYCLSGSVMVFWCHFDWIWRDIDPRQKRVRYNLDNLAILRTAEDAVPVFTPREILHGHVRGSQIFHLHNRMAAMFNCGNAKQRRVSRSLLLQLLLLLLEPEGEKRRAADREEQLAHRVRLFLDELARRPFRELHSIKDELTTLKFSYFHLERVFKAVYGVSPYQYINMLRIEEIKSLLRNTDLSVSEVAGNMGFCDLAYFSRYFKKYTGSSPVAFRKAD